MKKIIYLSLLVFLFISCDKNDDAQNDPQNPTDGFTINNQFYETPNCYIEFDDDINPHQINIFLTDGRMFDNDNNVNGSSGDYLFSVQTTNFVFYNIRDTENPSIVTPSYPNIQTGVQYIGGPTDSVIVHNATIESLSPPFFQNGVEFGTDAEEFPPNDPDFQVHKVGTVGPFITLNSYSFDNNTQTGTVDLDYTFTDAQGTSITGHYEGTIGILID